MRERTRIATATVEDVGNRGGSLARRQTLLWLPWRRRRLRAIRAALYTELVWPMSEACHPLADVATPQYNVEVFAYGHSVPLPDDIRPSTEF